MLGELEGFTGAWGIVHRISKGFDEVEKAWRVR